MREILRIVNQIQTALVTGRPSAGGEEAALAQEYADQCRQANARLQQCRRYASQGMAVQAMQVAEARPALLDLCAVLDFPGAAEWARQAQSKGWAVAPAIDRSALDCVNEAYASAATLEPSIKLYSRAVLEHDTRECTRILRRLAALDPASPQWIEDIRGFEQKRIKELEGELREAKKLRDSTHLQAMLHELNEKWTVDASRELVPAVETALREVKEEAALAQGRRIIAQMSSAYSALNFEGVGDWLDKYDAQMAKGYLRPDPGMIIQYDEAREWFQQEQQRRQKAAEFQRLVNELDAELKRPKLTRRIQELWHSIRTMDRPVEEALERQALHAIETVRLQESRRIRAIVAASAGALLLTVGMIVFSAGRHRYLAEKAMCLRELDQRLSLDDYDGTVAILEKVENVRPVPLAPFLGSSPEIGVMKRRAGDVAEKIRAKADEFFRIEREFTDLEGRFAEAMENPTNYAERVRTLLPQARASATFLLRGRRLGFTNDYFAAANRFEGAWKDYIARWDQTLCSQFAAVYKEIDDRMPQPGAPQSEDPSILAGRLAQLRNKVIAARSIPCSDATQLDLLDRLDEVLKGFEEETSGRLQLRSQVDRSGSLAQYLEDLKAYAVRFPQDPIAAPMKSVVEKAPQYLAFAVCPPVEAARPGDTWKKAEQLADVIPAQNGFWGALVHAFVAREKSASTQWAGVANALDALKQDLSLVALKSFRLTDSTGSVPVSAVAFLEGDFVETGTPSMRVCEGKVYVPKAADLVAEFKQSKIAKRNISVIRESWHCAFVSNLVTAAKGVSEEDGPLFILQRMSELHARTDLLNPLLKLKLMRFLGGKFTELAGQGALPELDAALQEMGRLDNDNLSWLCIKNPGITNMNRGCESVFRQLFETNSMATRYRVLTKVQRMSVARGVQYVGHVDLASAKLPATVSAREIWVLRPGAGGEMDVVVAAEWVSGTRQYALSERLECGEPLFAPSAKPAVFTRSLAAELMKDAQFDKGRVQIPWPRSWPINRRE